MTESESSYSNPDTILGNDTDPSVDISMRNEAATPSEEDTDRFFVRENTPMTKERENWYSA